VRPWAHLRATVAGTEEGVGDCGSTGSEVCHGDAGRKGGRRVGAAGSTGAGALRWCSAGSEVEALARPRR